MSVVLRVDKNDDLGEQLLERLRAGERQNDTIQFLCGDSTTREAHIAVLSVSSPYFEKVLKDVMPGKTVEVEFFGDIMDLVIEHMYTGRTLTVRVEQTVELYAAAKKFFLNALRDDLRQFLLRSMGKCLESESFLQHDKVDDVYQLTDVFKHPELQCDRIFLIQRITQWAMRMSIEDIRPIVDTISKPEPHSNIALVRIRQLLLPVTAAVRFLVGFIQWNVRNWKSVSIAVLLSVIVYRDERRCT